jgi:hypothetical protein
MTPDALDRPLSRSLAVARRIRFGGRVDRAWREVDRCSMEDVWSWMEDLAMEIVPGIRKLRRRACRRGVPDAPHKSGACMPQVCHLRSAKTAECFESGLLPCRAALQVR